MSLTLAIDLGTTTLTALALDTDRGEVLARHTVPNDAQLSSPVGFSEWSTPCLAAAACGCLRTVAEQLHGRTHEFAGLGLTGQQHGVVLVSEQLDPQTPFINWLDRRGEQAYPGATHSYVQEALARCGPEAPRRTGCRLAAGYLGVALFWLQETGALPAGVTACSLMDWFAALLTGQPPVTDPTCAAGSGVFNVVTGDWDADLLATLGLPRTLFPPVHTSGALLGTLHREFAEASGLPTGLPVFVGIGDNQASFLGSVADAAGSVLVNVGTGGQVAVFAEHFAADPLLETRPFPRGGYLLVCAGLCGGRSYALLERFFRDVGEHLCGVSPGGPLFGRMNELAAAVPPGADGIRCEPFFTGTRAQPELRASWTGVSADNFTPAHLTRALLEGMAVAFHDGYGRMVRETGLRRTRLVGAGNGLRENPLLARLVAEAFGLPLRVPRHREEAAYGAALLAAVGAGVVADLAAAGRLIQYAEPA